MKGAVVFIVALSLVSWVAAQSSFQQLTSIPGQPGEVPFEQYSGYIFVEETGNNYFFWFFTSQNDSANDPLVLWLTGGPGCSGLFGAMTENGPFHVDANGFDLYLNPYAWNKVANMIYIEQPRGVGYSYNIYDNYTSGDDDASFNNYMFMLGFYELFPQFAKNDFFIAGESYAGHYTIELTQRIVLGNKSGQYPKINLKGMAVGNPSTDAFLDANSYFTFMANHAIMRQTDYDYANDVCDGNFAVPSSGLCQELVTNLTQNFVGINPYDIYAPCAGGGPGAPGVCFTQAQTLAAAASAAEGVKRPNLSQTFVPCIVTNNTAAYWNNPDVRTAFGVRPESQVNWTVCSQILEYGAAPQSVIDIYRSLVGSSADLRILIYSGDVDSCVNYLGTEACIEAMGFSEAPGGAWRPWYVEQDVYIDSGRPQIAGYTVTYEGGFQYLTVIDAGHMVPEFQPLRALAFFSRYLKGEPF